MTTYTARVQISFLDGTKSEIMFPEIRANNTRRASRIAIHNSKQYVKETKGATNWKLIELRDNATMGKGKRGRGKTITVPPTSVVGGRVVETVVPKGRPASVPRFAEGVCTFKEIPKFPKALNKHTDYGYTQRPSPAATNYDFDDDDEFGLPFYGMCRARDVY